MKGCVAKLVLTIVTATAGLEGQSFTGAIARAVTDPSGAAVPHARLTATEQDSNVKAEALSDASGRYIFPSLRPGVYRIEAEASGFSKLVNPNIEVRVNDRLEINLIMVLGAVSETVEVTGSRRWSRAKPVPSAASSITRRLLIYR